MTALSQFWPGSGPSPASVLTAPSEPGAPAGDGGIPLCVPALHGNEWTYLKECLDTNWVSSAGPFVDRFERAIAHVLDARFAVATASGTAALHLALRIAGVEPGDEVLLPTLTFIAPANAVRYVGGHPVFFDVEPQHWQMDVAQVEEFLGRECFAKDGALWNRSSRRRVRAILPVHILGHPCDLDHVVALSKQYGLALIEDATESLGASWRGRMVGTFGHAGCLSFNGNKLITTGGGGMLVTACGTWAERARYLGTQAKDDPVEYVHGEVGYNYRMTNLQAALGCAQVEQIGGFLERKRQIAASYRHLLADVAGLELPEEAAEARSACWMTTIWIDEAQFGATRRELMARLGAHGIQARPLWQPLHLSPAHHGAQAYRIQRAYAIHRGALSLPSSVDLDDAALARVAEVIRETGARRLG